MIRFLDGRGEDFFARGLGGARRGGPKGEKAGGKFPTGVGTAGAAAAPMTPHRPHSWDAMTGLRKHRCIDDGSLAARKELLCGAHALRPPRAFPRGQNPGGGWGLTGHGILRGLGQVGVS